MIRSSLPHLATWLLQRFAFGPQGESLIGDIVEQYQQGRPRWWYWRQTLATVIFGSATWLRAHPRRAFRAVVLLTTVASFLIEAETLFISAIAADNWGTIAFNLGVFGYSSIGLTVLMLTITCLDEPIALSLMHSAET
jgi:hypothetical protein